MVNNSYDRVARYYDFLKGIVFGNAIIHAQMYLLDFIPPASNVLIVGGGTGEILDEITKLHPSELNITYVEISDKMIQISRKRNVGNNRIQFLHQAIEEFKTEQRFDVIITPFLFDNFKANKIEKIIDQLNVYLVSNGYWLYADFNADSAKPFWQKIMLKCMYVFFRQLSHIEADLLIDAKVFLQEKYTRISEAKFYAGFIRSYVFKKAE